MAVPTSAASTRSTRPWTTDDRRRARPGTRSSSGTPTGSTGSPTGSPATGTTPRTSPRRCSSACSARCDTYTPGTFEGWLHRITTNLFLDQARRKQRIRFDALSDERADRLSSPSPSPGRGVRRPHLRRRHRARPGHPAARLPRRGRALRRRGPHLRGDRRDPRRQARHRPLPHPPRPRDAAHRAGPPRARRPAASATPGPTPPVDDAGVGRRRDRRTSAPGSARCSTDSCPRRTTERAWAHVHPATPAATSSSARAGSRPAWPASSFDARPRRPTGLKGSLLGVPPGDRAARRCLAARPAATTGRVATSAWSRSAAAPSVPP